MSVHPSLAAIAVPGSVLRFVRAMVEWQGSEFEVAYFLEKPWKWEAEFVAWLSHGRPTSSADDGWAQFIGESE